MTMAYYRYHNVDTRIVRIFNTFGPRMRLNDGRVVPNFVAQALKGQPLTVYGEGLQTRSFCYVSDLVEGVYRLLMSEKPLPTNVGNPREMTILEFTRIINEITQILGGIVFEEKCIQDDPQTRRPDIGKARRILNNWEPKVKIEEGLRRTVAYFENMMV